MNHSLDRATAMEWVKGLYSLLLERAPDDDGLKHYVNALMAGNLSPLEVGRALSGSREFKARRGRPVEEMPLVVEQPPLPVPTGTSREALLTMLTSVAIEGGNAGELASYAEEDCNRFLYTLDLVPSGPGSLLEIGANPYFVSLLLKTFRTDLRSSRVNYFGGPVGKAEQTVTVMNEGRLQSHRFDYVNANIEVDRLPFEDESFDVILYCEVLEHMTGDPMRSLLELKRLLRSDGRLILTTPNVARLENVARLVAGANIYDPYSGYGPYGRHNREYTRHELCRLMAICGFSENLVFTADVHENRAHHFVETSRLAALLSSRSADLGQYLFSRWTNNGPAQNLKPSWLYRSYSSCELDPQPL